MRHFPLPQQVAVWLWKCFHRCQLKCQRLLIRSVPSKGHLCLFLPCLSPHLLLSVEPSSRSCPAALCLLASHVILLHGGFGCHCLRTLLPRALGDTGAALTPFHPPAPAAGAEKRQEEENCSVQGGEEGVVSWDRKGARWAR